MFVKVTSGAIYDGENTYLPGEVFELNDNHASDLIDAGVAEEVPEPAPEQVKAKGKSKGAKK
jgi:hypothetical protein